MPRFRIPRHPETGRARARQDECGLGCARAFGYGPAGAPAVGLQATPGEGTIDFSPARTNEP